MIKCTPPTWKQAFALQVKMIPVYGGWDKVPHSIHFFEGLQTKYEDNLRIIASRGQRVKRRTAS